MAAANLLEELKDGLKIKRQQLEADVDNIKESQLNLVSTNTEEVEALRRNNDEPRENEVREHIPVPYDNLFQAYLSHASRRQSYF